MRYLEMGFAFASVGFVALNLALSLMTVLFWRIVRSRRLESQSLFALRMLPAIGSASLVFGLVLPAYVSFEPRETTESGGPALAVFFVIGLALVAAGIRRTISSWRETRRVERRWLDAAIGRASLGIPVRAYHVSTAQPLAALVGVLRPRLFVSDRFLNALTAGEQEAVIEHEAGHLRSLDNLKRTAMRLAPDWLNLWSTGREIEKAWAAASEAEADDHAAGPDRSRSLDLASALLKASRFTPTRLATVSNFCDESTIASRVTRLLEDQPVRRDRTRAWAPWFACALALAGAAAVLVTPALRAAYHVTEAVIRLAQ